MTYATFEKTHSTVQMGAYVETSVDVAKRGAEVRILDADGSFTVRSPIELSGKGIVARHTPGFYEVSKAAMKKLQKEFNVVSDF